MSSPKCGLFPPHDVLVSPSPSRFS